MAAKRNSAPTSNPPHNRPVRNPSIDHVAQPTQGNSSDQIAVRVYAVADLHYTKGERMLSNARYEAALPCSDLERAKSFYADKLGLTPADEQSAGAFYDGGDGTRFLLFRSTGSISGSHARIEFIVADVEAEVNDLKQRGVQFEVYDVPGFDQATSIAEIGEYRQAWFKDSEGNLLGILQR